MSEELGIPCVIINPALSQRLKEKIKPPVTHYKSPLCIALLGDEDAEIDYKRTLLFLEKDQREGKTIITKVLEGEKHPVRIETFEEVLPWVLGILRDFREAKYS